MSLLFIVDGDFGQPMDMTVRDVDTGLAVDISGYSTEQVFVFKGPDGEVTEKEAEFKTDGVDGIIRYVTEDGFFTSGYWRVRGRLSSGTARLTTTEHRFKIIVDTVEI